MCYMEAFGLIWWLCRAIVLHVLCRGLTEPLQSTNGEVRLGEVSLT